MSINLTKEYFTQCFEKVRCFVKLTNYKKCPITRNRKWDAKYLIRSVRQGVTNTELARTHQLAIADICEFIRRPQEKDTVQSKVLKLSPFFILLSLLQPPFFILFWVWNPDVLILRTLFFLKAFSKRKERNKFLLALVLLIMVGKNQWMEEYVVSWWIHDWIVADWEWNQLINAMQKVEKNLVDFVVKHPFFLFFF